MDSRRWRIPFFTMWTAQAFSLLGSALVQSALISWLTEKAGSARLLATASSVAAILTVPVGRVSGVFVDRWRRRWVLVISDELIAFFTALLGLLFWLDVADL